MKYLHDDALAEVTASLTACPISSSGSSSSQQPAIAGSRIVHGRLEAYTMKRARNDRKYAIELGNKFTAEQEALDEDLANQQRSIMSMTTASNTKRGRKRSVSTGEVPDTISSSNKSQTTGKKKDRSNSINFPLIPHPPLPPLETQLPRRAATLPTTTTTSTTMMTTTSGGGIINSETVVNRRLLTDLILTLNHSFPDYDFATATSTDFVACSLQTAVQRINERLSELAVQKDTVDYYETNNTDSCFLSQLWTSVDKVIQLSQVNMVYCYQPPDGQMGFLQQTLLEENETDDEKGEVLWSFNYFFVNKQLKRILLFTCIETMHNSSIIPEDDEDEEGVIAVLDGGNRHLNNSNDGDGSRLAPASPYDVGGAKTSIINHAAGNTMDDFTAADDTSTVAVPPSEYNIGGGDDDASSTVSIDFDLDPADAVSGGIPVGKA